MNWIFYVVAAVATAVLGQMLLLRLQLISNSVQGFLISGVGIGLCLIVAIFRNYPVNIAFAGTLLYAFLCELHIFIFTMAYSSVSANLLIRLRHRAMTQAEIDQLYDDRAMIRERLEGLRHTGLIEASGDAWSVTSKGLRLARLVNATQGVFGHQYNRR